MILESCWFLLNSSAVWNSSFVHKIPDCWQSFVFKTNNPGWLDLKLFFLSSNVLFNHGLSTLWILLHFDKENFQISCFPSFQDLTDCNRYAVRNQPKRYTELTLRTLNTICIKENENSSFNPFHHVKSFHSSLKHLFFCSAHTKTFIHLFQILN